MTSPTLNRLYASGGSEALLNTLQITVGGQDYWLVENFEDITAATEAGGDSDIPGGCHGRRAASQEQRRHAGSAVRHQQH